MESSEIQKEKHCSCRPGVYCTCNSGEHILSPSDCSCDIHIDLDDSEAKELVEVPVEHAVNPSTLVDVNNGLAGVQAAVKEEAPVFNLDNSDDNFGNGSMD